MVIGTSGSQCLYKDLTQLVVIKGSESRITSIQGSCQLVYLSRSSVISKFQIDHLYHFLLLTTRKRWKYGLMKQCLQTFHI